MRKTDVFISYSRNDRARLAPILRALELNAITYWYDELILPGENYKLRIQKELESARCAIVIWTQSSVIRDWVKAEANRKHKALVPIVLDKDLLLPPLLEDVQVADLSEWDGDPAAENWRKVVLAVKGVTSREKFGYTFDRVYTKRSFVESLIILIGVMFLLAGITYSGGPNFIVSASIVIATLAYFFFREADAEFLRNENWPLFAIARQWLFPVKSHVRINVAQAFNTMLDAVFGGRHLSFKCIWRSFIASTLFFLLFLALFDQGGVYIPLLVDQTYAGNAWLKLIAAVVSNSFIDYISIFETRAALRIAQRRGKYLWIIVVADFVVTAAISIGFLRALNSSGLMDRIELPINSPVPLYSAAAAATFLTSVWLWLTLIFTPIVRFLMWTRDGLTTVGKVMGGDERPFRALAFLIAPLIFVTGVNLAVLVFLVESILKM